MKKNDLYFMKNIILYGIFILCFTFILSCSKGNKEPIPINDPGDVVLEKGTLVLKNGGNYVNYILPKDTYERWIGNKKWPEYKDGFPEVSKKIYKYFKDNFDFIFIFSNSWDESIPHKTGFSGTSRPIRNDIKGLGWKKMFDYGKTYGSPKKLQHMTYIPVLPYLTRGPFLHEIMHRWANHDFLEVPYSGHWGFSSVGGALGGFTTLTELGNNKYLGKVHKGNRYNALYKKKDASSFRSFSSMSNGGNQTPYSDTELYLMGLLSPEKLNDIKIQVAAENAKFVNGPPGTFTADGIKTYTFKELIKINGERIPNYKNSQKHFRGIVVIISEAKPISQKSKNFLNKNLPIFVEDKTPPEWIGDSDRNIGINNFWTATDGKATLDIHINKNDLK